MTLALLAGVLLISLAIVVSLPTRPSVEAQAQVMAVRLDQALGREAAEARLRIAVLPFVVSGATEFEGQGLGDALSQAVNEQLVAQPRLQPVGRQSVEVVSNVGLAHATAARVLGADYLLLGELIAASEHRIEVRISLWDAALDDIAWTLALDGTGPRLQEVPRQIAARLQTAFPPLDTRFAAARTNHSRLEENGYRQYLMAKYLARRGNALDAERAIAILDLLLQESPQHTPAHIARARALLALNAITGDHWPEMVAALEKLEREALPAAPLDPALLGLAATAALFRGDWPAALERAHHSAMLDPNQVDNLRLAAQTLLAAGYLERATELARQAALLDPVATGSHQLLALLHGMQGNDDDMVRHAEIARDLGLDTAGYFFGFADLRAGELDKGVQRLHAALEAAGGPTEWLAAFAAALRDQQQRPAAIRAIDRVEGDAREFMNEFFVYYAMLGATERSLESLRRLARHEPGEWAMHLWLPELASVRRHPEFGELLAGTSLPEAWQRFGAPDLCAVVAGSVDCR